MANKKTVVQMYEEIKGVPGLTDEQIAFLNKRIEITQKKNANRGNGEPTPKQKEQMALNTEVENAILAVMVEGATYTPTELVKFVDRTDVASTQKLTPRLTALVEAGKVVKSTVKGRSVYSLPTEG